MSFLFYVEGMKMRNKNDGEGVPPGEKQRKKAVFYAFLFVSDLIVRNQAVS